MNDVIKAQENQAVVAVERAVMIGDLSQLKPEERMMYYKRICDSVGLNPLTRPLEYITLNGKLTLYARKDATDQLRNIHGISIQIAAREVVDDCYVVTARATNAARADESIGAVPIGNLKGDAKCNAMMKAETKAKRRVTLSICGLGLLDETEIDTIPESRMKPVETIKEPVTFTKKSAITPFVADQGGTTPAEAVASAPAETTEYTTREQQDFMRLKWLDALPQKYHGQADALRRDWLHVQGYVRDDKGSSTMIPRSKFKAEMKRLLEHARSFPV